MSETGARKWIITFTVILASVIELIDTSIVNVALPQMMGNLGATLDDATWIVTAYVVANVIVVPMTGWLAALFGRRNYFVGSIVLFTVASFFAMPPMQRVSRAGATFRPRPGPGPGGREARGSGPR